MRSTARPTTPSSSTPRRRCASRTRGSSTTRHGHATSRGARPMMPRSLRDARGDSASGQVLVLFALLLVVLLMISALAIDYGAWLTARRNYQNLADAASLAGAQLLTRPLANSCT